MSLNNEEVQLTSVNDASKLIEQRQPLQLADVLEGTDATFFGDVHNDYAITEFMIKSIPDFKRSKVVSVGFEVNPDPSIQAIFDQINSGDLTNVDNVTWARSNVVMQKRIELVQKLSKAGIKIYPFANWDSEQSSIQGKPYSEQSEQLAASIIKRESSKGKTVVFVGAEHASYKKGKPHHRFPHTIDHAQEIGLKVKSFLFAGGMNNPAFYDRSEDGLMQRALHRDIRLKKPEFINISEQSIKGFSGDGIILLPEAPFIAANDIAKKKFLSPRSFLEFLAKRK